MCDVCNNRHDNCPACSTPPDRSEPIKEEVTVEVTHCKNCPLSIYGSGKHSEQYDCIHPILFEEPKLAIIAYYSDDLLADEMPKPEWCPLLNSNVTIKLKS